MMMKIQKCWLLLALAAFSVSYAMNDVEDDNVTILSSMYGESEQPDNTTINEGINSYSDRITNVETGEAFEYSYSNDNGFVRTVEAYESGTSRNVEADNTSQQEHSSSASNGRNERYSNSTHDSYADSVLDSNMQDRDYWQQQREAQDDESAMPIKSEKDNQLPNRTYSLDALCAKLRAAERTPGYYKKLDDEIARIEAEMAHAWTGNAVREKQVEFLRMMQYGNVPACLSRIQHGSSREAQKALDKLEYFWPWTTKTGFPHKSRLGFLIRNPSTEEQAFIAFIGGDMLKDAERCLASRESECHPSLLRLHRRYIEMQKRGDLQGLQRLKMETEVELSKGRINYRTVLSYRWTILDTILADQVTHVLDTIAHGSLSDARAELQNLQQQVYQFYREYNVTSTPQASATVLEQHGFDLLAAAQTCFQNRPDYDPRVEFASSELRTLIFITITDGTLEEATSELHFFEKQLADHFTEYKVMPEKQTAYMITNQGYDVRAIARALYKARSDYDTVVQIQHPTTELPLTGANTSSASSYEADSAAASSSSAQPPQQERWRSLRIPEVPREMRSARRLLLEALGQATGQAQLADRIDGVRQEVFDLAHQHNYEIHPEVKERVYTSIRVMRVTEYAHELVFHVAAVDRALNDIQIQAVPDMAQQQTVLERSPELLVHGLKTFFSGLNPIAQAKGLCELLVDTASFTCDMTAGKLYLSPKAYQARKDGFWETMDALSPENLAQLSAEHWVELAANMAAGVVVAGGIYKTVTYLKEIEATSRAVRQAAKIAGALKGAVDTVLAEHPIAVTAQGVLINNYDKIEEVTEEVVAVVKNSQTLLEFAAQKTTLLQDAAQKVGVITKDAAGAVENLVGAVNHYSKLVESFNISDYDPSIGNLPALEKAVKLFEKTPGALTKDGPLAKALEFGKASCGPGNLNTARGAMYELEKAVELVEKGETISSLGQKLIFEDKFREFDIITETKLIECKNIDWLKVIGDDIGDMKGKFGQQSAIAKGLNKLFEIHSKQPIPQDWKSWFIKKGITFFEG
jgi:hypothetical protein